MNHPIGSTKEIGEERDVVVAPACRPSRQRHQDGLGSGAGPDPVSSAAGLAVDVGVPQLGLGGPVRPLQSRLVNRSPQSLLGYLPRLPMAPSSQALGREDRHWRTRLLGLRRERPGGRSPVVRDGQDPADTAWRVTDLSRSSLGSSYRRGCAGVIFPGLILAQRASAPRRGSGRPAPTPPAERRSARSPRTRHAQRIRLLAYAATS